MPEAVTRQERDALAAKQAQQVRPGRVTERRGERDFPAISEVGHVVQAAAADDSNLSMIHGV
jgi:hypothetical protein